MVILDLVLIRGDSRPLLLQIKDDHGAVIDITDAIAKFSMKRNEDDPNTISVIQKLSYDISEIEFTDPPNGHLSVKIRKQDTVYLDASEEFVWDVELTRRGVSNPPAQVGTAAVTAGSGDVIGTGTAFKKLHVGDIVVVGTYPVTVMRIDSDTKFVTDFTGWATSSGLTMLAFEGDVKTPIKGKVSLTSDVTR